MKKLFFTTEFITTIDELLNNSYDKIISREDIFSFLHFFERKMTYAEDHDIAWFSNHQSRVLFGYKQINKKRFWKLDLIIKKLQDANIIIKTAYDKGNKRCRSYSYSALMSLLLKENNISISTENCSESYYKTLLKYSTPPIDICALNQYSLLKSNKFSIDIDAALNWINNIWEFLSFNQRRCYLRSIFDLHDKQIFTTKSEKTGRIFTNFNMLKRELREFCIINNKRLISIDLHTSQPYFLACYLIQHFPENKEVISFYKIVTENDIYNWFLSKWNEKGYTYYKEWDIHSKCLKKIFIETRDDAKIEFLKIIFKDKGNKPQFLAILESEFPFIYSFIQDKKSDLAIILQRQESQVFLPVCGSFANECLSVHDSLFFLPEIKSQVQTLLEGTFHSLFYFQFKLKINNNNIKSLPVYPISGNTFDN